MSAFFPCMTSPTGIYVSSMEIGILPAFLHDGYSLIAQKAGAFDIDIKNFVPFPLRHLERQKEEVIRTCMRSCVVYCSCADAAVTVAVLKIFQVSWLNRWTNSNGSPKIGSMRLFLPLYTRQNLKLFGRKSETNGWTTKRNTHIQNGTVCWIHCSVCHKNVNSTKAFYCLYERNKNSFCLSRDFFFFFALFLFSANDCKQNLFLWWLSASENKLLPARKQCNCMRERKIILGIHLLYERVSIFRFLSVAFYSHHRQIERFQCFDCSVHVFLSAAADNHMSSILGHSLCSCQSNSAQRKRNRISDAQFWLFFQRDWRGGIVNATTLIRGSIHAQWKIESCQNCKMSKN